MTVEEMRNTAREFARSADSGEMSGEKSLTLEVRATNWHCTAEICTRLDKLIEQGERDD